jgi:putative tryptophan/tyrosine transport system substrate-binding protein
MKRGERQEARGRSEKAKLFGLALCVLVFATYFSAEAQQPSNMPSIGFLSQAPPAAPNLRAFRDGLRENGYFKGKNIVIEYREAGGNPDRLPSLAADLVRLNVDGIVVVGSEASLAAKNATAFIPIIMAVASDPVGTGLVASYLDREETSQA